MRRVSDLPQPVEEIPHIEVPMPDGCRLAARLWRPESAAAAPVPAILEYIPYRKNDMTYPRDHEMQRYIAGHGYAVVRLDLRGSGESEGILRDEYLEQELQDGADAIAWIAEQPWCDGNVGMIGISWGGFNGLQIAAKRPPALKAVVTCCSTDDRYADDVHYMNGCLLGDNLSWAAIMFSRNSAPPDPEVVGTRWRELWLERLEHTGHWLDPWLTHQHRDAYWQHGSVCEDFAAIQCPVYAVSGWADGYVNSVFRLLENLQVPRKGLVGPWAHIYPHAGTPGPAIGFLQECLRWWDHWLKGRDTGIADEPMLRAWIQDPVPPQTDYAERPGRWVAESSWPPAEPTPQRYILTADGGLAAEAARADTAEQALDIRSPLSVGRYAGKWCSYAKPGDQPGDQKADDSGSLQFETAPLAHDLEILGEAALDLTFSVDKPVAMAAVRLNDVHPDGAVTRVTYAPFNLCHRDGHGEPHALEPGQRYRLRIPLKHVGQRFAAGHRLRVAISTVYWPLAWPAPEPVTLTVVTGATVLELPVRPPRPEDDSLPAFAEPEAYPPLERETLRENAAGWRVIEDLANGRSSVHVTDDHDRHHHIGRGLTVGSRGDEWYGHTGNDPASARGETRWHLHFERPGWRIETDTWTLLTCDRENFYLEAELIAWENGSEAFRKHWNRTIPRRLV